MYKYITLLSLYIGTDIVQLMIHIILYKTYYTGV